jgi:signal transduction histidine kinase
VISDVPRALAHLRSTVSRMSVLVDDLFALSRVQGASPPKPPKLVSLAELIDDVGSEAGPTAQAHQVRLEVDVPADDRLAVLGSADDLARALANLVGNAIRHTEPGRAVRLFGSRAPDGHVQVAVVDGCGGIPEQNLARVFDTGWRGSPSRGGDDGGAGLGLAITRGVIESHAGRIEVSNVTGGCRFDVVLPAP